MLIDHRIGIDMSSQGFHDEDLAALIAVGTQRSYPKNTLLISEGDHGDQIYVVLSGKLKVFLADSQGKEIIVSTLGPSDYFGEMSLGGEPRSASVMTVEASKLAVIQSRDFKRFLSERPSAAHALILRLIDRARHLTLVVSDLALVDVYGRIARLLLDSAQEIDGQTVAERLTHREIAKRVNCSRETVSRILNDLRKGDYIALDGDRIVIRRRLPARW